MAHIPEDITNFWIACVVDIEGEWDYDFLNA